MSSDIIYSYIYAQGKSEQTFAVFLCRGWRVSTKFMAAKERKEHKD